MKKIFVITTFLLWTIFLFGQPEIKFDNTILDFGHIEECNDFVSGRGEFHFTNIGTEPLIIYRAPSSGGILGSTTYPKEPILSGERGVISFAYMITGRAGTYFNKSITVTSNATSTPIVLMVKGKFVQRKVDDKKKDIILKDTMDSLVINSKKIDFEYLKQLSDKFYHRLFDCDSLSTGTTVELRYCLNMQLQREDSLLKKQLQDIITNITESNVDTLYNNISIIEKIEVTQEIWERYRFAYCNQCLGSYKYYEKADTFSFLKCAIELTIKRREDIEKMCEY